MTTLALQPQTSVEPGELRETHGGGGGESPAKCLNPGGGALFPSRQSLNRP
jgi:hypothetical protein